MTLRWVPACSISWAILARSRIERPSRSRRVDYERIAFAKNRECLLQFGATVALNAARLLLEDGIHPGALQHLALQSEVLVHGRDRA
jgi:hypothetical protein